ncbi:MAG: hypothetical protein H6R18_1614 [Proteobacteria bacterium]|nr:hypothetical protein [Pseudomonadota bacterium]
MSELDVLSERLQLAIARRPSEDTYWREPTAMPAALARVRLAFGERLSERSGARTNRCLLAFRMTPQQVNFVDLKLICRAVTRPADWEQRRLIDDDRLFDTLLAKVDALRSQPRRHQACLRALEAASRELMENAKTLQGNELRLNNWLETAQH